MIITKAVMDSLPKNAGGGPLAVLSQFRLDFHACLTARADELCELADAVLCAGGPVRTLAGLSLAPEHRRGHGALYDGVNHGRISVTRLRRVLAGLPLPRAADGRLVLAVDVSNWLRPGAAPPAAASPGRIAAAPAPPPAGPRAGTTAGARRNRRRGSPRWPGHPGASARLRSAG